MSRPLLFTAGLLLAALTAAGAAAFAQQTSSPPPPAPPAAAALAEKPSTDQPAAAGQAPAPTPSAEELGAFVETVEVNVVNVDVYVTDKKGNRVTGLTRDDFTVLEDGRPMEITNFYAVEPKLERRAPPRLPPPPPPAGEAAAAPPAEEPEPEAADDQQLYLVVYVDNFNLDPLDRNRVLKDLRLFLADQVQVGDQVMLVTNDHAIHIRHAFTSDPEVVASALSELEPLTGNGRTRESDRQQALDRVRDAKSSTEALTWARAWAREVDNDLRFTVDSLKDTVSSLAGLPGRKAILYVSDGIPMSPGQDVFHAVDETFKDSSAVTEALSFNYNRQFSELAAQANANRITFYTLDAGGLRGSSDFDASNHSAPINGVGSMHTENLQEPLRYVARTTGGIAILNTNRAAPQLERVGEDFKSYYSLGYHAPEAGRGRYHKIDVKVKRKGLEVRHRDGYRDRTAEARMSDSTTAALLFPFERNPLGISIAFGEQTAREDRLFVVAVQVRIPIGKLALVPHGETSEARLRLFIAAIDADGGTSPVQQVGVPISVPKDQVERAKKQYYQYTASLLMRGGPQTVAVGVRDELGGDESFATGHAVIGR
jgi:VWFA-related protein